MLVFLQAIIAVTFVAGFGAFGSCLQPERSESSACMNLKLIPRERKQYTVTSPSFDVRFQLELIEQFTAQHLQSGAERRGQRPVH